MFHCHLSSACLSHSWQPDTTTHTHPDKHKQAHTHGLNHYKVDTFLYCCYNRLLVCKLHSNHINIVNVLQEHLLQCWRRLHNTHWPKVYCGLIKLNGRFSGLCGAKHPNDSCLPVCVHVNKSIEVKLHTQPLRHTCICAFRIKGTNN